MSTKTYRTLDDVNRLLADVWATYPVVYANASPDAQDITLAILPNIVSNSKDFCKALISGETDLNIIARGGFGEVGPFRIKVSGSMKNVYMHVVSFKDSGKSWVPYYMEVYAKHNPKDRPQKIYLYIGTNQNFPGRIFYVSNDFLHESIVGGFVSHLYDIGVLPGVVKYFGTFVCPESYPQNSREQTYSSTVVMEKSSFELSKILGGLLPKPMQSIMKWKTSLESHFFNQLNIYDLEIWLAQLAHTFFISKLYFGISHFDVHIRNVLLTYVKSSGLSLQGSDSEIIPIVYGGKLLSDVDYIRYTLPFSVEGQQTYLVVENNGLLPKLIDYGLSIADFPTSSKNKDLAFRFENSTEIYQSVHGGVEAAANVSGYGDVEWNYIAYNLIFQLTRLENYGDKFGLSLDERRRARDLREALEEFFYETVEKYNFSQVKKDMNGRFFRLDQDIHNLSVWFMSYRDVGTTSNIIAPLYRIFHFLKNHGKFTPGKPSEVYITRSGNPPPSDVDPERVLNIGMNLPSGAKDEGMDKYLTESKRYYHMCLLNGGISDEHTFRDLAKSMGIDVPQVITNDTRRSICYDVASQVQKIDPNSILRQSSFKYTLDKNSPLWDQFTLSLKRNINLKDLRRNVRMNMMNFIYVFDLVLEPQTENSSSDYVYKESQRMSDGNPPSSNLIGTKYPTVKLHMIYYRNGTGYINLSMGKEDIYDSATKSLSKVPMGVSISGGMFAGKSKKKNAEFKPIGFYYDKFNPQSSGTYVPVPQAYHDDWGVIMISGGYIKLGSYSKFLEKHQTEKVPVIYYLADDNQNTQEKYPTTVSVIKMIDNKPKLKSGEDVPYDFAMASGPILVSNGNVIMTDQKLDYSQFILNVNENPPTDKSITAKNNSYYKLIAEAPNVNMYFSDVGENKKNFIYNQRNSNYLTSHSVIAETNRGDIMFFFIEGEDFNSVGLDRAELAKLVSKFDIKNAMCFDGGFTTNAVIKNTNENPKNPLKWLMPNIKYQRPVCIRINIGIVPPQAIEV